MNNHLCQKRRKTRSQSFHCHDDDDDDDDASCKPYTDMTYNQQVEHMEQVEQVEHMEQVEQMEQMEQVERAEQVEQVEQGNQSGAEVSGRQNHQGMVGKEKHAEVSCSCHTPESPLQMNAYQAGWEVMQGSQSLEKATSFHMERTAAGIPSSQSLRCTDMQAQTLLLQDEQGP